VLTKLRASRDEYACVSGRAIVGPPRAPDDGRSARRSSAARCGRLAERAAIEEAVGSASECASAGPKYFMTAWLWFLSSYAPLWAMLGLRFHPPALRIICFAVAAVAAGIVAVLLYRRRAERPTDTQLTVGADAGADVSGYLASYLLPFLTVSSPSATDLAAYVVFLLVAGLIYVRSGLMQINPTVYLLGWRVLRASIPVGAGTKEVFLITRGDRRVGVHLRAERFADRVYIDHGKES
jgi:hypothetical protein